MVVVKRSTLQDAEVKGGTGTPSSAFDLHSWQGLTAVLKAGRDAGLNAQEYAVFRDLVLEYAQKRGDAELKTKIDLIVNNFSKQRPVYEELKKSLPENEKEENKTPTITRKEGTPEPSRRVVQTGRRTPSFTLVQKESVPEPVVQAVPENTKQPEPIVLPLAEPVEPTPEFQPVVPPVPYSVDAESEEQKAPEENHEVENEPPTPENASVEEPKSLAPESLKSVEEYRVRITEIKRMVNAHVGNPITLIDSKNNLGRTYMNALLTAMKATGPGSTQDPHAAMAKLEEAFSAIDAHAHEVQKPSSPEEPPVISVPEKTSPSTEIENAKIPEPQKPEEIQTSPRIPDEVQVPVSESPVVSEPERKQQDTPELPESVVIEKEPPEPEITEPEVVPVPEIVPEPPKPHDSLPERKRGRFVIPALFDSESKKDDETVTPKSEMPTPPSPNRERTPDIEKQTTTLPDMRVSRLSIPQVPFNPPIDVALPHQKPVRQDELAAPEVSAALNELLHEWKIFAGSGLFGIGPGGMDHPLYQQLSKLSMGEVVSGRWEGAKPSITRTIKDYIDAWRHEQAIAYNPTETFDHYLRRVVERILKRQKGEIIV